MNLKVLFILTMLVASSFVATGMGKRCSSEERWVDSDEQGNSDEQGDIDKHGNMDERGDYYGGDMRLREDQKPYATYSKSGTLDTTYRWPNGLIPYELDPAFTSAEKGIVRDGMKMIESCTCMRFTLRINEARYLKVQRGASGTGCYSDVGCQPDRPTLTNFQYNGCIYAGICAHEFLHAIGLFHQQSRPDRDTYVRILFENIDSTKRFNFDKYSESQVSTYGTAYDCSSILHYSPDAFSMNGNDTIDGYNCVPGNDMGQRSYLTKSDCKIVNEMYKGTCINPIPLLDLIFG